MQVFRTYNDYLRKHFGQKIQKVSVDMGGTCPNRDGSKALGGCTYCNNDKFHKKENAVGNLQANSLKDQIELKISKYKKRNPKLTKFIVYFQTYSNTYGELCELEKSYLEALSVDGVVGLSIGTRPDCLNDEIFDLLENLSKKYFLTLELGLESSSDLTLLKINRGHDVQCFIDAANEAKRRNLLVCAHVIFGFPWENVNDILKAANIFNDCKIDFVKIHNLQIVKKTLMAHQFLTNPFHLLNKEEYLLLLKEFLLILNPNIIVSRFAGDCAEELLIASGFNEKSPLISKEINQLFFDQNLKQGQYYMESK